MVSFVKSVTFDCSDPLALAAFWAAALGSSVDEDSTERSRCPRPEEAVKGWRRPGWRQVGGPSA